MWDCPQQRRTSLGWQHKHVTHTASLLGMTHPYDQENVGEGDGGGEICSALKQQQMRWGTEPLTIANCTWREGLTIMMPSVGGGGAASKPRWSEPLAGTTGT